MAITVSKVQNLFSDFIRVNRGGKARFKFAIADANRVLVSKGSYIYETNITTILRDYASGKNGEEIIGVKLEKGVRYKINGHKYNSDYVEVVVLVSNIVSLDGSKLASFIAEESRECHDRNSRDKHIQEMVTALRSAPIEESSEEPVDNGEDA